MRTRIGRKLDINRLSSAVKRPGIDPRCWKSLAVALEDSFVDKDHGVFVNVILMPTEEEYTARVGAEYAGGGFGFYAKIKKDDELSVGIPSGDPAEGPIVLKRLWSAADLPPQQAIDDPEEVMLVVEKDKNLRLAVSGAGQVLFESEKQIAVSAPKVLLGSLQAVEALIKGTTYRAAEATMNGTLGASLTAGGVALAVAGNDPTLAGLAPTAAAALVTAGTAISAAGAAVTTFEGSAGTFLSAVSSTD